MPYCTRCGRPLKEGEQCTCTRSQSSAVPPIDTTSLAMFFYSLGQRMGIGDPTVDPVNKYERGQKIVPENVTPNDTEVPVKTVQSLCAALPPEVHAGGRPSAGHQQAGDLPCQGYLPHGWYHAAA